MYVYLIYVHAYCEFASMSITVFQTRISTYRSLEGSGGPEVGLRRGRDLCHFAWVHQIEKCTL